jgi:hypothetical protein
MKSTLSAEQFEEIAAKHGGVERCRRVDTVMGTAVFRKPDRAEVRAAVSRGLLDPKMRDNLDAVEPICRTCVVHPPRQEFVTWCEEYPLTPIACVGAMLELAGLQVGEEGKG